MHLTFVSQIYPITDKHLKLEGVITKGIKTQTFPVKSSFLPVCVQRSSWKISNASIYLLWRLFAEVSISWHSDGFSTNKFNLCVYRMPCCACASIFKRYDPKEYEHSRRFEEASSIFHLSIANTADHCTTVCQSMLVTVVVEKAIGYILILILFVRVP